MLCVRASDALEEYGVTIGAGNEVAGRVDFSRLALALLLVTVGFYVFLFRSQTLVPEHHYHAVLV